MGLSENSDDHIFKRHQELCSNLNMDSGTTAQAWDSYESIRQHYTLEGDPLHWLGCAIYVACRKSTAPTVGQTGSVVKGNYVSLTRLLRLCNFSLTQFFAKSKKWADMANMPQDFRKRIDRLERNFAVSFVAFKKYHVIFNKLFLTPVDDQPKQHRSRKQRNLPCTPSRIFEFCWTLFVCIKGEFVSCSDDLVTSFHLLLACCDMAFSNALLSDRRDLLNPKFSGLPENWSSPDYVKPTTAPCIIDILCQQFEGIVVDAKRVKEYSWKVAVNKLFNKDILHGETLTFSGLFEATNFDSNMRAVNKVYEEHVLNVGEFDEKIFIAEYRRMQLISRQQALGGVRSALRNLNTDGDLTNTIGSPKNTPNSENQIKSNLAKQFDDPVQQLVLQTPLTGRKYHRGRDIQRPTPLSTATQSVIRLQTLLNGRTNEPNAELRDIFSSCLRDPSESIKNRVRELGEKFIANYDQNTDQSNGSIDIARNRLTLAETLYYKLLENIVHDEKLRNPNLDITCLLEQDVFHRCMFACSIEIVIYSYNCQKKFPWILQALDLKGYYFYRVIELIVRTKDQLSRDVVKHLNSIEEQILEAIAWENDSPLWECLAGQKVPSCEDTALPGQLDDGSGSATNPSIKKIQTPVSSAQQSPITPASERFQSPITNSVVKKKLFVDSQSAKVKPGQSLLQNSSKTVAIVVVDDKGNKKLIPLSELSGDTIQTQNSNVASPVQPKSHEVALKPKRNGSLALFFRKFYNLAGVRMEELCNQLQVDNIELKRKIFTCFEHCIIELTSLMKDRHLDQILMCAVYVVCRSLEHYCDTNLKLFLGDDFGSITTMTFLQQKEGLLRKKHNDKMTHYYWIELPDEKTYVHIETFKKIHSNLILNMKYYPETCSIISCSRDNKNSVVFFNLKERKKTYTFKISQGVCCFSLSHESHILLTGSDSGTIHLWNLYVSSKAITTFQGHKSAVIDLQILAFKNVALTCSRDGVLKIWSLLNHSCDNTITIKFPCFEVLGKNIEWGKSTIYSGPKRLETSEFKVKINDENDSTSVHEVSDQRENKIDIWQRFPILISCCNYIAKLNVDNGDNNFNINILPPPPLQNEIIIPEDWKIGEPETVIADTSTAETGEEYNLDIKELHPVLKSIIEKDFLKSLPRSKHNMNYKIAALDLKKLEMKKPVSLCAPYLALDLFEIEEVRLSPDLPVPNCKKTQQIVDKTQRLLSAASSRSGILSDRSSKSKSSRSSVIEF